MRNITELLRRTVAGNEGVAPSLEVLERSIGALHALLDDLTTQARLDAGQETREVRPFDASATLRELCATRELQARERGLHLRCEGPDTLPVEGDEVKTGQILRRLDDREHRAVVAQLEAELRFLRSELERVSELARRGVTTTQVEERARSQLDQAIANVNAARQRVEDFLLRAPMDGTVLRRDGEVGEIARPEDVLFWIGRASPLRIEAEVDEEDIPLVAVGQPALIKALCRARSRWNRSGV